MKKYTTTTVLWRHGLEVPAGTELTLSDAEAKYLHHALAKPKRAKAPVKDEPAPEPAAEPEPEAAADPSLGAGTEELPADRTHKRRHRNNH